MSNPNSSGDGDFTEDSDLLDLIMEVANKDTSDLIRNQRALEIARHLKQRERKHRYAEEKLVGEDWVYNVNLSTSQVCQLIGEPRSGKTTALACIFERAVAEGWVILTNMSLAEDYSSRGVYYFDSVSEYNRLTEMMPRAKKQIGFDDVLEYYDLRHWQSPTNEFLNALQFEARKEPNTAQLWLLVHQMELADKIGRNFVNHKLYRPIKLDEPVPASYRGVIESRDRNEELEWWSDQVQRPDWLKFKEHVQSHFDVDCESKSTVRRVTELAEQVRRILEKYDVSLTLEHVDTVFGKFNLPGEFRKRVYSTLKWENLVPDPGGK